MKEKETKPEETKPEELGTVEDFLNERVPFYAMLDDGKYKDDIFQTVNGKTWQIQRGENVMIPRFVYLAIMDAERQKRNAALTSRGYEEQFSAESNKK